jgi:hypothetical protein
MERNKQTSETYKLPSANSRYGRKQASRRYSQTFGHKVKDKSRYKSKQANIED